jgi:LysM repeat protein
LVQLRQRISIIARLKPFTPEETQLYVNHRLRVAGYDFARPLFTKRAQEMIARFTQGIPRNINNVCFNAMSLGCVAKQRTIDVDIIGEVLGDLDLGAVSVEQARTESVQTDSMKVARPNEGTASMPVVLSPVNSGASPLVWRICSAAALAVLAVLSFSYARTRANAVSKIPSTISRPAGDHRVEGASSAISPHAGPVAAVGPETVESQQAVQPPPPVGPPRSAESKVIFVRPDETLYRISVEAVGKYDANVLARLRDLNPWLNNPNHIEVGQKIRFPDTSSAPQTNSAAEQVPAVRVAGSEKP